MRSCPACHRTYADSTLTYCLDDGTALISTYNPAITQPDPSPRATNAQPTEFLPTYLSQLPQKENNHWQLYTVIALLCVMAGGGVIIWLKSGEKSYRPQGLVSSPSPQAPNNSNQPETHENAVISNAGGEDQAVPQSEERPPSWKLVGAWRAKVSEFGEEAEVTFTANGDGTYQYSAKNAQGQTIKDYGTWQYSEGILYQRFSNGASGKGSIEWIDNDTLELTILDNGVPAYSGLKRRYHRIK